MLHSRSLKNELSCKDLPVIITIPGRLCIHSVPIKIIIVVRSLMILVIIGRVDVIITVTVVVTAAIFTVHDFTRFHFGTSLASWL